jgi:Tfp pilus assembly protein FimV
MHVFPAEATIPDDPKQWLPLAAMAMGALYLFVLRPMKNKRKSDPMESAPIRTTLAQQRHVEREMEALLVELSEMSRKITAQLDTRTTKLEILIAEADAKIEQLKALQAGMPAADVERYRTNEAGGPISPARVASNETFVDPRHVEVYALADQGRTPAEIAEGLHRPRGEIELILALRSK